MTFRYNNSNRYSGFVKKGNYGDWTAYGPTYGTGDVVGCGLVRGRLFFTKNGHFLGVAFKDVFGVLYPCVELYPFSSVVANFGQTPFLLKMDWNEIRQRCGI